MKNQHPIRIMIVDDHEMVRRGLGLFIRGYKDLLLVGEAANGMQAVRLCGKLQPDVILMDIVMPEMNGIEAIRIIRQKLPDVQIIMLTSSSDSHHITEAIEAGATSYLMKNVTDDQLANAIRAAREGEGVMSPEATQALIKAAIRPSTPVYHLSDREIEVLRLMTEGLSNLDISERLYLSRSTVKYHISGIFTKLGVTNRSEAISFALKNNLV